MSVKTDLLKDCLSRMNEKNEFHVGQIVGWKEGLKNKRSDGPMIIVEILAEPIVNASKDSGTTYFMEPLDIILGHVDADGDFVSFHYDSRRFQPVND